ncbi:Serine/threonine-protein kinase PrkC [Planctomycetales bacterium 10988]|nr:Serine/threonine-protein kinase PrkC [Planctomycetales bacterium 10988]
MATVTSAEAFLDLLKKSRLVETEKLEQFESSLALSSDEDLHPKRLAARCVDNGILTTFHCRQLLQGKWKGFFVQGKYKVLSLLGAGGAGRVYLCQHTRLNRLVAVKFLPPQDSEVVKERFYREARAVASLNHPNIVRVFDIDHSGKLHFMVLEYVDGINLQDLVQRNGWLSIEQASHYIRQAAAGLQHAHDAGWGHRDIKPSNILLDRSGVVKILDLGLARFFQNDKERLTITHEAKGVLGTVDYLSPEQAMSSEEVDFRTDIYSLGATLRFLVTGQTPFGEGSMANILLSHQLVEPKKVQEIRRDIPREFSEVIRRMMAKKPEDRFQSMNEVINALEPWGAISLEPPPEEKMPKRIPGIPTDLYPSIKPPAEVTGTPGLPAHSTGGSPSAIQHLSTSDTPSSALSSTELSLHQIVPGASDDYSGSGTNSMTRGQSNFHDDPSPSRFDDSHIQALTEAVVPEEEEELVLQWRGAALGRGDNNTSTGGGGGSQFNWETMGSGLSVRLEEATRAIPIWTLWFILTSGWLVALGVSIALAVVLNNNAVPGSTTSDTSSTIGDSSGANPPKVSFNPVPNGKPPS